VVGWFDGTVVCSIFLRVCWLASLIEYDRMVFSLMKLWLVR
jgi:hypothetical protein